MPLRHVFRISVFLVYATRHALTRRQYRQRTRVTKTFGSVHLQNQMEIPDKSRLLFVAYKNSICDFRFSLYYGTGMVPVRKYTDSRKCAVVHHPRCRGGSCIEISAHAAGMKYYYSFVCFYSPSSGRSTRHPDR